MKQIIMTKIIIVVLCLANSCLAAGCSKNLCVPTTEKSKDNPIDAILKDLSLSAGKLTTYSCKIEYLSSQPLFESRTLRKGMLYYQKDDEKSMLRINFDTLKQDDEKEEKSIDQYIFEQGWLTHIDYKIKEIRIHQLAEVSEPNQTIDVFEMVSKNFPIIGFSRPEELKKEFKITIADQNTPDANDFICLHLKVKPGSVYKDDYTAIDFWIDKKLNLPAKIEATTIEEDIYQIKLADALVNKKLKKDVFRIQPPKTFGKPKIIPLKKQKK